MFELKEIVGSRVKAIMDVDKELQKDMAYYGRHSIQFYEETHDSFKVSWRALSSNVLFTQTWDKFVLDDGRYVWRLRKE